MLLVAKAAFIGIGLICGLWCSGIVVTSILKLNRQNLRFFEIPFMGFTFLATTGLLLSLFFALSSTVLSVLWGGTLVLTITTIWRNPRHLRRPHLAEILGTLILLALLFVVMSAALARGHYYDTGLYHLQRIRWIHELPLQLGLVNLHSRLAFATLWPEVLATFFVTESFQTAVFLLNPATYILVCGVLWFSFVQTSSATERWVSALFLIAWIFGFTQLAFFNIGSPATDLPAAAFTTLAFFWATLALNVQSSPERKQALLLLTCSVSLLAVLTKLSQLPVLILPLFLILKMRREARNSRPLLLGIGLLAVLTVLFLLKNILLSGCLLHPSESTCIPSLPWSPTLANVHSDSQWIRSWARQPFLHPDVVLADWKWLSPWFQSLLNSQDFGIWAITILAASATFSVLWILVQMLRKRPLESTLLLGTALSGIVFWFLQAPDPRFGFGFFVACTAGICIEATSRQRDRLDPWLRSSSIRAILGVLLVWGLATQIRFREGLHRVTEDWPRIEKTQAEERKTEKGLKVWTPSKGSEQCWDHPIPCTPYFDNSLREVQWGWWRGYSVNGGREP